MSTHATEGVCFYAGNDNMSACQQKSVAEDWMEGRSSTPKQHPRLFRDPVLVETHPRLFRDRIRCVFMRVVGCHGLQPVY